MFRRIAFWILIIFFVAGIVGAYIYFVKAQNLGKNIYASIPSDCPVLLEFKGIKSISSQANFDKKITNYLFELDFLKSALKFTDKINNYITENDLLKKFFLKNRIFLAGFYDESEIQYTLITQLPTDKREANEIFNLLKKNSNVITSKKTKREFFKVLVSANSFLFITKENENLIISSQQILLDEVLAKKKYLNTETNFLKLNESLTNNKTLRCFINTKNGESFFRKIINSIFSIEKFAAALSVNWFSFDLDVKNEKIDFNGFVGTDSTSYVDLLKDQSGVELKCHHILPENTLALISYGFSDFQKFSSSLKEKIDLSEIQQGFSSKEISRIKEISENIVEEMSVATILFNNSTMVNFALFKIQNLDQCRSSIRGISDTTYIFKSDSTTDKIIDTVFSFKNKNLVELLSGGLLNNKLKYCFFIEDFIVFTDNKSLLSSYESAIKSGMLLETKSSFKKLMQYNLNETCNVFSFSELPDSLSKSFNSVPLYVKDTELSSFNPYKSNYSIGIQLMNYKNNLILQGSLIYNSDEYSKTPELKWRIQLDTIITNGPFVLKNHNTLEEEILVQDAKNQIYLLDDNGIILWKKIIDTQIIGKVHQVDFYKNKKLQMLFNTSSRVYLLDRNGKDLNGYPINLNPRATNPINVFDYDNNGEFRIAYINADYKLVILQPSGKIVEGFKNVKIDRSASSEVEWRKIKEKDYLFVKDDDGKIHIFSRKGEKIFSSDYSFCNYESPIYISGNELQSLSFYKFDPLKKEIIQNSIRGRPPQITRIEDDCERPYFTFKNINEDEVPDLILIEEDKIKIFDGLGNFLLALEAKEDLVKSLSVLKLNGQVIFAVLDSSKDLFFINQDWKELAPVNVKLDRLPVAVRISNFVSFLGKEILFYEY